MASRLTRRLEKKNRKQMTFTIIGIGIMLFLLFQFGIWAITNISGFLITLNEKNDAEFQRKEVQSAIVAPLLDPLPAATTQASIEIKGKAPTANGIIELYLNDDLYQEVNINDSEDFKITINKLKEGENVIEARFVGEDDKRSGFSKKQIIIYSKEPPKLEVSFPSDNSAFKRGDEVIEILGKTDIDNKISVNDFIAIVDENGDFSYNYRLSEGDNIITIIAENAAGAKTEKKIKVTFSP